MAAKHYDLIVIGAGSGGIAAARAARFRGASVAMVSDGPIGGDCTWTGCVPSKALLSAAGRGLDFEQAMASVTTAVETVANAEDAEALGREGIDVLRGYGLLRGAGEVEVAGSIYCSKGVILSPGSGPALPPIDGLDRVAFITNERVFELKSQPQHLLILGGGPIGCEMAEAFARLGSTVTLLEAAERVLPRDDPAASAVIARSLSTFGADLCVGSGVVRVAAAGGGVDVELADGATVRGSHLLVAAGRRPTHMDMDLDGVGVRLDRRGWIEVNDTLETSLGGVYAVGDAIGGLQFTHAAAHMARLAVDNALRVGATKVRRHRYDPSEIPWVTFTSPEVAQVGMTEQEAVVCDLDIRVVEVPLHDVDRAVAAHRTDGFIKMLAAPRRGLGWLGGGRLVGATIVADRAGEMISEAALAIRTGMFVGRLAQTVHPYPTWSVGLSQAAAVLVGDYGGLAARTPRSPGADG
ncbi:MAG: FAD-dependent oxidoreductase [Actinomycetia bacterium]|nr:FAD-dependent oxidoreductase [Actinomycetes bacterium]MCP4959736.1 FAD-dependent oxidoreductase [Actinomycetes bacterium]